MYTDDREAVVVDGGSSQMKAGYSGDDTPSAVFENCIGYSKERRAEGAAQVYIGDEAQSRRSELVIKYPVDFGLVNNWEDMEKVWQYTFYDKINCVVGADDDADEDCRGVMITEGPLTPRADREKTTEIMFEKFGIRRFFMARQAVLALYAAGRTSGVSVDIGISMANVVPVHNGHTLPRAVLRNKVGGRALTNYLLEMFHSSRGGSQPIERSTARSIKERVCYVAMDYESELQDVDDAEFALPDGETVTVRDHRISAPELLFKPKKMHGKEMPGIHELVHQAILKTDHDMRADMSSAIVLSGGGTLVKNFPERLELEVQKQLDNARVIAVPDRQNSVFVGGALLTGLSTFDEMWIPKESDLGFDIFGYDEIGPAIVHQLCDF